MGAIRLAAAEPAAGEGGKEPTGDVWSVGVSDPRLDPILAGLIR